MGEVGGLVEEGKSAHTGVCWSELVLRWCVGGWRSGLGPFSDIGMRFHDTMPGNCSSHVSHLAEARTRQALPVGPCQQGRHHARTLQCGWLWGHLQITIVLFCESEPEELCSARGQHLPPPPSALSRIRFFLKEQTNSEGSAVRTPQGFGARRLSGIQPITRLPL